MADAASPDLRLPLTGALSDLGAVIAADTGRPGGGEPPPRVEEALRAAFPLLPRPEELEGCTTHPALLARFRVPGLGRESVKLVLVPREDRLEARVRAEVPEGSYRAETLSRIAEFLAEVTRAVAAGGKAAV